MQNGKIKICIVLLFILGFTGLQAQTVKDLEGNVYKTITIDTQVWMAENLKTLKYNDGTAIPLVIEDVAWEALTTPAYCWYDKDATTNKNTYGVLYNWFVVNTNKLCPKGWHVPTDREWKTLTTFLGGEDIASGKLRETGTTHWQSPNDGATNESGFTALPGGYRDATGTCYDIGVMGYWWSSSEVSTREASYRGMSSGYVGGRGFNKQFGFSVRCLRD
jgi:uncharacterized protein (TIGR02145 family)